MKKNEKNDMLFEYERKSAELEDMVLMLSYIIEDYYVGSNNADIYTKANYFDRLKCYLTNINTLLYKLCEEMVDIINNEYELKKQDTNVKEK